MPVAVRPGPLYWPRQTVRWLRALWIRRRIKHLRALAVTGSCGKTSASAFLARILESQDHTHAGLLNNDENGIMRTIRKLRRQHRFYVQEASGHQPGQLRRSLSLVKHEVGIVTTVGLDHYREFRTREAVAQEKGMMVELLPKTGVAVLNADDPYVAAMASRTRARVMTYGCTPGVDVMATDVVSVWPERLACTVHYQGESARLETMLFGDLLLTSVLAAIAGALAVGVPLAECVRALHGVQPVFGRLSVHRSPNRMWMVYDFKGTYWTVEKILELASRAKAPRKTLVFGSFSDTSGASSTSYRKVAKKALKLVDRVVWAGPRSSHVLKLMNAQNKDRLFAFAETRNAAEFLGSAPIEDELVIIKSNNMEHLERLIIAQEADLGCWINKCDLQPNCQDCPQSGLMGKSLQSVASDSLAD